MKSKAAFVGRFLGVFAVLVVVGWLTDAPARYAAALRVATAVTSPLANGWSIEQRAAVPGRQEIWFRRGTNQLRLGLSLDALALGLLPLFSLLGATPGLRPARRAACLVLGGLGLFALDLLILLLYPYLVPSSAPTTTAGSVERAVTDIAGTFLGLLTFVGGPVILWFSMTFRELRGVWRLG